MLDDLFRGWTPIIILAVVVLLFGATRLPALARSLGQSRNAFKAEMKKGEETGIPDASANATTTANNAAAIAPASAAPAPAAPTTADSTAVSGDAANTTNSTHQS